jgi:hypothetical protein
MLVEFTCSSRTSRPTRRTGEHEKATVTIAIGLAFKEGVVLAADSAVTHGRVVTQSTSSLGETSELSQGIEEGALKIAPLGTHAAAAMAGTADDAVEALAWFRPHVQGEDFVAAWKAAMLPITKLDFAVLVARWHGGRAELFHCDGATAVRVRLGWPMIVGSASDAERETFEARARTLLVRGNQPHMIQLGVSSLLVWRALNEVGFKDYIGGTPASILVNSEGTSWMPDTSVYSVEVRPDPQGAPQLHEMIHRVSIIGRENVVAVASTYTKQTRLLVNPMTEEKVEGWIARWRDDVLMVANENRVALVGLVAIIQRRIALLEVELCQDKYIKLEHDRVTFGEELKGFFLGPPPRLPGGALFSIPLGEPRALAMVDTGGPDDEYDVSLGVSFMILTCVSDKKFDDAERVWRSLLSRYPHDQDILTAGLVCFEMEPGAPRLDVVLAAWEAALAAEPALVEQARFVATKHPAHPEVATRLLDAVERAGG